MERPRPWIDEHDAPATVSLPVGEELVCVVLTDAMVRSFGVETLPLCIQDESNLPVLHQNDIRFQTESVLASAVRRQRPHRPLGAYHETPLVSADGRGNEVLEHVLHREQQRTVDVRAGEGAKTVAEQEQPDPRHHGVVVPHRTVDAMP